MAVVIGIPAIVATLVSRLDTRIGTTELESTLTCNGSKWPSDPRKGDRKVPLVHQNRAFIYHHNTQWIEMALRPPEWG